MVSFTQVEGKSPCLWPDSGSEESKGNQAPFKDAKSCIYCLGTPKGDDPSRDFSCADQDGLSLLDSVILSLWEDCAWKGQLRYDVTACEVKTITGGKQFLVQFNDKWNPHFREEFESKFFQPMGYVKSNHMNNSNEGMLFCVSQGEKERSELVPSTVLPKNGVLIVANENPIEYGHIFLVPHDTDLQPLLWDNKVFELIMRIAAEVNNFSFRVFFDYSSSTTKHVYFQAGYFPGPLPVERFPTIPVYSNPFSSEMIICEIVDYPMKVLVLASENLKALAKVVSEICCTLRSRDSAFNLLITECGTKIFLFPQVQSGTTGHRLSTWQCGGYFVYDNKFDYDAASEMEISESITSVSLDDSSFQESKHLCCSIAANLGF